MIPFPEEARVTFPAGSVERIEAQAWKHGYQTRAAYLRDLILFAIDYEERSEFMAEWKRKEVREGMLTSSAMLDAAHALAKAADALQAAAFQDMDLTLTPTDTPRTAFRSTP